MLSANTFDPRGAIALNTPPRSHPTAQLPTQPEIWLRSANTQAATRAQTCKTIRVHPRSSAAPCFPAPMHKSAQRTTPDWLRSANAPWDPRPLPVHKLAQLIRVHPRSSAAPSFFKPPCTNLHNALPHHPLGSFSQNPQTAPPQHKSPHPFASIRVHLRPIPLTPSHLSKIGSALQNPLRNPRPAKSVQETERSSSAHAKIEDAPL
jgi:hypothetical protein